MTIQTGVARGRYTSPTTFYKKIMEYESCTKSFIGYKLVPRGADAGKLWWISFTLPLFFINPCIKIRL